MKKYFRQFGEMVLIWGFPLAVCLLFWIKSDPPPYGTPINELSDQCWGIYQDLARQWKSGDFSFWTRSIGGGFCLYTSGFYPLWVPLNIFAKILTFDQFYLFKIIEPYFIGLVTMLIFLRRGLRLSYPLAIYGTLVYSGYVFTRYVGIIHFPFFMWACAVFPLMVHVYQRLAAKHIYVRSVVLGGFMALIYLGGGAGQFAQMIIWCLILLVLDAIFLTKERPWPAKIVLAAVSCIIFIFFAFAIAAGQIIPMAAYTLTESSRTLGEYPINNFPLFRNDYKGDNSIFRILRTSVFHDDNLGVRAFWALMLFALGKLILDWKSFREWCSSHRLVLNVFSATIVYFMVPPIAETLSHVFPFLTRVFNPFRMFTFGYTGFLIDLVLVVFLVVVLSLESEGTLRQNASGTIRRTVLLVWLMFAQGYLFFPLWTSELWPQFQDHVAYVHWSQRYLVMVCLFIFVFPLVRYRFWQKLVLVLCLGFLGMGLVKTSFVWGEKGRQTDAQNYHLNSPEHRFYRKMQGRLYMPFVDPQGFSDHYPSMTHNYELLYGVDGLNGFLNIPPQRLSDFVNAYHNETYWIKNSPAYKFPWRMTPSAFVSHFPVEFTTIKKDESLPWPGFSKAVDGEMYDVWTRDQPVENVRFAADIRIVSYRELVGSFDKDYEGIIYMTSKDARTYHPPKLNEIPDLHRAKYANFVRQRPDHWTFDVETPQDVFVMLPEMFQKGWQLSVDGQKQLLFPADSIFMGFLIEKGHHHVELKFRPVFWTAGWMLTFGSGVLFLWVVWLNRRRKKLSQ